MDGIPHKFFVNSKIDMHNAIPHGTHKTPRDGCIYFFDLFGNLVCSFTDYDEVHFHRTDRFIIVLKGCKIHPFRKFPDFINGIQNIANSVFPVSR